MTLLKLPKQFHPDFALPDKAPVSVVAVDYSNSLSKDISGFFLPANTSFLDAVRGVYLPSTVNPANATAAFNTRGRYIATTTDHEVAIPERVYGSTEEFTITWLAAKTTSTNNTGMVCGDPSVNTDFLWMSGAGPGGNTISLRANNTTRDASITGITNDELCWRSITQTNEGAVQRLTYYAKGLSSTPGTTVPQPFTVNAITAGFSAPTLDFEGKFQGLMIHDRALTEAEILALHANPYQLLKPKTDPVYFVPSAAVDGISLTGTVTASINENDINTGGKTIILTLAGDTWVAAGATFDAQRQNIIDGCVSAQSEAAGWNAVRPNIPVTSVVRTSSTIVTITLPAL